MTATQRQDEYPAHSPVQCVKRADPSALWSMVVPGRLSAAFGARAWVRAVLGDDHPRLDTAVLIVSELVTNAVLHSASGEEGGKVHVRLESWRHDDAVRISVVDDGKRRTAPEPPVESMADNGRGLEIVQVLSAEYDAVTTVFGRRAWALIA